MRTVHASATLAALTSTATITLLAACSSSPAPALSRSGAASSPAAAVSASPSLFAQQALAAYTAMWGDVQALSETSDYTNPRLGNHLDGQAYATISENMSVNKAQGIIGLGAPVLHPRVLATSAAAVTIADCMDDTHWLEYYASTRKPVDNMPGGHRYTTATVTDENGTWKVTTIDTRGDGSCT